jgi:predicted nucleic acid-binding protein
VRVFLDANVLFTAAHNPDGLSRLLFDLASHKVLSLVSSELAIEEARTNLNLKAPDRAAGLESLVAHLEIADTPAVATLALDLPDDDRLIVSAAHASRATHLLTGDKKHFARYFDKPTRTGGITIQTVRAFFADRFGLKG